MLQVPRVACLSVHLEPQPEIKLEDTELQYHEDAEVEADNEDETEAAVEAEAEAVPEAEAGSDDAGFDVSTDLNDSTPPPSPIKRSLSARESDEVSSAIDDVPIKTRKITAKRSKASK
jgi:hypothetical protein